MAEVNIQRLKRSFRNSIVNLLYPLYLSIAKSIRTHPLLIRRLFNVRLYNEKNISWDFTTLILKHALRKRLKPNMSVLEIGVGRAALLCIYLARRLNIKPDGVDIIADRVDSSLRIARYNHTPLRIWQSDFFEQVENKYDLIFWNASYIPTGFGNKHHLTGQGDLGDTRAWDGGDSGAIAIARFLSQAPQYLSVNGEILLGVNHFHVPRETISRVIQAHSLTIIDLISRPFNPSLVYVLGKKEEGG
jgi:methylase of polypeptide subunit release factors